MSRRGTRVGVRPARGRARGLVALVLALAAGLAGAAGLVGPVSSASAAEPDALATITLTSVSPSLPTRDGTITLEGRVTNTSKEALVRPQALLWRDQAPITDADGLDAALGSASNVPIGSRLFTVPSAFQNLYTADAPELAPGRSATFTVSAPVSALALAPTDGVYLVGVHVTQRGIPVAIARSRVLVPVLSREPERSLRTATLVVLDTRPSLLGPGLVSELETMRAGYLVRTAEGGTSPGTGQADATRWLEDLARLKDAHDGYRLLLGSPDVAALAHADRTDVLRAAADAGRRVAATADLPLLVLPAGGAADDATLRAAEALHPRAVLLSDSATRGAGPLLATGSEVPVLTYTAGGLGGGPGPDPSDDAVHIRQRALATSWVETETGKGAEDGDGTAQVHLVQSAAQATSTGTTDPPWAEATPLADVLDRTPARWDGDLRYPGSAADEELGETQLAAVDRLASTERTWSDLLVDGDAAREAADAAVARAASSSWRGRRAASTAYVAPQQASLDARLTDQVRISSSPKVSTVAQQGVEFPITIRNDLAPAGDGGPGDPTAIRVRLVFVSDNSRRLAIRPVTPEPDGVIAPGSAFQGNAAVTARANGTVPVVAQLYTASGRKVGRAVPIEVQVTQNGTTGWAIAIVAGLVLAGSTTWRIRQVGRERARQAEAGAGDDPALGSVPSSELGTGHDDAAVGS